MRTVRYFLVDNEYLRNHPEVIFVYDGNFSSRFPKQFTREFSKQLHPFITHILPRTSLNLKGLFFTPIAYLKYIYPMEERILVKKIMENPDKQFLIDPLGYFVTYNPWDVYSTVIYSRLRAKLKQFKNVTLLWLGVSRRIKNVKKTEIR